MPKQSTDTVLMVSPTCFMFNEENAATNPFQHHAAQSLAEVRETAMQEFDDAVARLRQAGVNVLVHTDTTEPPKPDAIFCNNWFTTWPDGRVFLYPMAAPNRRLERETGAIDELEAAFAVSQLNDLSASERQGRYLEATGAMVFDHINKTVFGSISARCDEALFRDHARHLGYEPIPVHAYGSDGAPIYHTNILVAVQTGSAVVCLEDVPDAEERKTVLSALARGGRQIVEITHEQLKAFCANVLELEGGKGRLLVMSEGARNAFSERQLQTLQADKTILAVPVPVIEEVGGGSIRCMLGEIFLPPGNGGH